MKSYQRLAAQEELLQGRDVEEALQRGVHVASVAQVGKADKSADVTSLTSRSIILKTDNITVVYCALKGFVS